MKKYDIPQIELMYFLDEIFVSSSGVSPRAYINEIGSLEDDLSNAFEKRMESFTELMGFN